MSGEVARSAAHQSAYDALLRALEEFHAAYDAWSRRGGGPTEEATTLLAQAEKKVEAARAALAEFEAESRVTQDS